MREMQGNCRNAAAHARQKHRSHKHLAWVPAFAGRRSGTGAQTFAAITAGAIACFSTTAGYRPPDRCSCPALADFLSGRTLRRVAVADRARPAQKPRRSNARERRHRPAGQCSIPVLLPFPPGRAGVVSMSSSAIPGKHGGAEHQGNRQGGAGHASCMSSHGTLLQQSHG